MPAERPALFDHCLEVYTKMVEEAVTQEVDGVQTLVYRGFLTKLFKEHRISVPYYSTVMTALTDMQCAIQLRRGGGNNPSEWLLLGPPELDVFKALVSGKPKMSKKTSDFEAMEQHIRDLSGRVAKLEETVKALWAVIQERDAA